MHSRDRLLPAAPYPDLRRRRRGLCPVEGERGANQSATRASDADLFFGGYGRRACEQGLDYGGKKFIDLLRCTAHVSGRVGCQGQAIPVYTERRITGQSIE